MGIAKRGMPRHSEPQMNVSGRRQECSGQSFHTLRPQPYVSDCHSHTSSWPIVPVPNASHSPDALTATVLICFCDMLRIETQAVAW